MKTSGEAQRVHAQHIDDEILRQARVLRFALRFALRQIGVLDWEDDREIAETVADALAEYHGYTDDAAQREFCGRVVAYLTTGDGRGR